MELVSTSRLAALLPDEGAPVVLAQTLKGGALPLRMGSLEGEPATGSSPAQPVVLLVLAGLVGLILCCVRRDVMHTCIGRSWRAVVVGILVLLATLAAAAPATAAPVWQQYKSYVGFVSINRCHEEGQDLVWSLRYKTYTCVFSQSRNRVYLLVSSTT